MQRPNGKGCGYWTIKKKKQSNKQTKRDKIEKEGKAEQEKTEKSKGRIGRRHLTLGDAHALSFIHLSKPISNCITQAGELTR